MSEPVDLGVICIGCGERASATPPGALPLCTNCDTNLRALGRIMAQEGLTFTAYPDDPFGLSNGGNTWPTRRC